MKRDITNYTIILASFLTVGVFASYTNDSPSATPIGSGKEVLSQKVEPVNLDKDFLFAGERLPTENFDVRERLEQQILRYSYYHSATLMNLKRTGRFFPMIEKILAENGLPEDLKFLAVAESALTNATSPAGAKGYWQFMRATGKEYGLEINNDIDERMHLEKSTRAACKYLKKLKARHGSWAMAAAAYNMGSTKLNRESAAQRSKNYYDLNLNQETGAYIFRIVALKEILSNPTTYGFYMEPEDFYQPLDNFSIVVQNTTVANLGDFAAKYGTSYRQLKVYNPWLKSSKLPNASGKEYKVLIPRGKK